MAVPRGCHLQAYRAKVSTETLTCLTDKVHSPAWQRPRR
jgi:hypothetical protein